MNQRVAMVQRVANSRKLVLELRQWFPGLLRLKDDNDLEALMGHFELFGEIDQYELIVDWEDGGTSGYTYKGLAEIALYPRYNAESFKNKDLRILNPKTGRPQVKYLEKFLSEELVKTYSFYEVGSEQSSYWPHEDVVHKIDLKIKRIIPKKDQLIVQFYIDFNVWGHLSEDQIESYYKEDDRW